MDQKIKDVIENEIAPLLQNGDITLFLGAGISIGTPAINDLGVPSTPDLIKRICNEAKYSDSDAKSADLPTAFGVGEDEVDNFENFLISNFTVKEPHHWQVEIFQHWWRAVFTTNIDTIPEASITLNKQQSGKFPDYQIFNYLDREPVQSIPIAPPVVYLHGMVSRPSEGFVFDSVSYADNSVNQSDWLSKCSLHISHGNCLFVGSKFKESDIESSLRRRKIWESESLEKGNNWIVLRDFTELERKSYERRGIIPIQAEAEEFFKYLFSLVSPLTQTKFIRRKAPYLSDNIENKSSAWFLKNMEAVTSSIERAKQRKGPLSRFYNGDMPDWFYIHNNVPTEFTSYKELLSNILKFERSDEKAQLIPIIGPLGSGKTTSAMLALSTLSKTHNNIYEYIGLDGIDIEYTWRVIKDLKGVVVIYIDAASGHFYAINELIDRVLNDLTSCRLCVVVEERTLQFERNKRHLHKIPKQHINILPVSNINNIEAEDLLIKTESLGIKFEKLQGLSRTQAIEKIVNYDNGYKGDLLATLYDLSSRKSYREQITEEYEEIHDDEAKIIYETISLVTASRLAIPINYICEIHSISVQRLISVINNSLNGKVIYHGVSMTVTARHHSISEYHVSNNFDKYRLKFRIIDMMKCLSAKFSIEDIKKHPISYKIYSKILSYHYLTEILYKKKDLYGEVHEIYSECQKYFYNDGVFWLQYGRFLERDEKIDDALHCFRKGLELYDSFQIRHALGHILLKKYRRDNSPSEDDFYEGVAILQNEVESRGETDAYPYTAMGNELIKIYMKERKQDECASILKDLINRGLQLHREDKVFAKMVTKYLGTFTNARFI